MGQADSRTASIGLISTLKVGHSVCQVSVSPAHRGGAHDGAWAACSLSEEDVSAGRTDSFMVVRAVGAESAIVFYPPAVKNGRVTGVAFSRDGSLIASGPGMRLSDSPILRIRSAPNFGKNITGGPLQFPELCTLQHPPITKGINCCSFFPSQPLWHSPLPTLPPPTSTTATPPLPKSTGSTSGTPTGTGSSTGTTGSTGATPIQNGPPSSGPRGSSGGIGSSASSTIVQLASGCQDGTIRIWRIDTSHDATDTSNPIASHMATLSTVPRNATSPFSAPCSVLSLDTGKNALACGACVGAGILLWDVEKSEIIRALNSIYKQRAVWCRFESSDGQLVFSASREDKNVVMWDARGSMDTSAVSVFAHPSGVNCCSILPNDITKLATGSTDGTVLLWDTRIAKAPVFTFPAHEGSVLCCDFHVSGSAFVTGSASSLRLWDTAVLLSQCTDTGITSSAQVMPAVNQPELAPAPEKQLQLNVDNISVTLPGKYKSVKCSLSILAGEIQMKRGTELLGIIPNTEISKVIDKKKAALVMTNTGKQYQISCPPEQLTTVIRTINNTIAYQARLSIEKELHRNGRMWQETDFEIINGDEDGFASGSFGAVFKAICKPVGPNTFYAVKLLRHLTEEDKLSFMREMERLYKANHQYVLGFFGFFKRGENRLYMVTEFIDGGDLTRYLYAPEYQLPISRLIRLAANIASGMAYLHDTMDIIHRDLKPANVLVKNWDESDIKICDLGIARDSSTTQMKTVMGGTVGYSAPEMAYGSYTWAVDVFSYGIMLWEMATRQRAWLHRSTAEITERIRSGLRLDIPRDYPEWLSGLITRCWAHNPETRPHFGSVCLTLQTLIQLGDQVKELPSNFLDGTAASSPGSPPPPRPGVSVFLAPARPAPKPPGASDSFPPTPPKNNSWVQGTAASTSSPSSTPPISTTPTLTSSTTPTPSSPQVEANSGPKAREIQTWPVNKVGEFLPALSLEAFVEKFRVEDIDGQALLALKDPDMRELGLSMGQRKRLQAFIEGANS
ncbi:Serine/threonine-protein kinase HT1 [Pelomyxa schiedti]|nr:Serine/threonine-protein kinase HT1 [Pelomyxa schiedti]